jgi:hypothetical protein
MSLRLLAETADDLKVISAALQDAVAKLGDIAYEPAARRLTLVCNRFRWEAAKGPKARGGERVRAALQLNGVSKVQARGLRRDAPEALVSLLAIDFEPSAGKGDPGGVVVLHFAGHADIRLEVECLDAVLADVSDPWATPRRPGHG